MNITLTDKQIEAHEHVENPENKIILYGGAIRGGKSFWLIIEAIFYAMLYPVSRSLLIRKSLPTIKRNLLPTLNNVLDLGFRPQVSNFNLQTNVLSFKNGSEILIMAESYDADKQLNRFRGLEINAAFIDELNELQKATFFKIIERSGTWLKSNGPIKIVATCNPAPGFVKKLFYDRHENNTLPKGWKYIPAKITDNPYLPKSYLESLKANMPAIEYSMFVDGNWDAISVENPFAYEIAPHHFTEDDLYDETKPLYISIDFNLNPFSALVFHRFIGPQGPCLHIIEELSIKNGSIPLMIDTVKRKYYNKLLALEITGDAMGNNRQITQRDNASLYELLRRGLNLSRSQIKLKANPHHKRSRRDCNFFLKNFFGLKINKAKCPGFYSDLYTVKCDTYGKIIKTNRKNADELADFLDCFRYIVNTYYQDYVKRNPLNSGYQRDTEPIQPVGPNQSFIQSEKTSRRKF